MIPAEKPLRDHPHGLYGRCLPIEEVSSGYYLRLSVIDYQGSSRKLRVFWGRTRLGSHP